MTATDVEAVLFDLDDTLCEYRRTSEELLELAFEDVGVEPLFSVDDYYRSYAEHVADSDGMADLRERCFAALVAERGRDPALGRELARVYTAERDHANVRALPGAIEVVETLSVDHRLGLVTNGAPDMQREKLSAVGLADAFETVVFAGYDAPAKPAPEPFEVALSDLGVEPGRAVHVGNSRRSDVGGAGAAGLGSVLVPDRTAAGDGPDPDYLVESLEELVPPPWRR